MSPTAFTLILVSAVMHALWNLLVKRSRHKTVFIWWMFVASLALFSLTLPFAPDRFRQPEPFTLIMIVIGAVCFVLYHLLNGRAYRGGDLSVIYPLSQTSMIYVPVWGVLLLGEKLSVPGCIGILAVASGAYSVQMRQFTVAEMFRPFRDLRSKSVQAALAAGFVYSIGSIAEKVGVRDYSPFYFTYYLVFFMFILMSFNISRPRYRGQLLPELREHWGLIMISGPVMMTSFLTFRYGLNLSPVSYAVPVRQMSIMVSVLIGILFLGESSGRIRLVSALVMLAGAIVIRLG